MGNLRKLKLKMKLDHDLRHTLIKGQRNEILIDLDGDKEADIAILDLDNDGNIDAFALDLDGDGELGCYVVDSNKNGVPDKILADLDGNGELTVVASGEEVEQAIIAACALVERALAASEYIARDLDAALDQVEKEVRRARKELKRIK